MTKRRKHPNYKGRQKMHSNNEKSLNTYEFGLRYDVAKCQLSADAIDDRLYLAGCDDALVRHSKKGELLIEFLRAAPDAKSAFDFAHQQILQALPQAQLLEARPDYVGPTDIAQFFDVSRQRIQLLLKTKAIHVHPLTSVGNTQIFRLSKVIDAFLPLGAKPNPVIYELAQAARQINQSVE